ncbi:hypothetical protein CLI64_03795 [Nostoc sp. CENA543]|uniref:cadherin-like domain-containing protein n=1 Tax=Nostoc sp. CENA543 TaxID=1869241 RepID=UPI000CA26707|nr:cadherin-like domain-containing protein [Nostoc sp. CENA543]AUS99580.1 hypothetical protein CLI64_03795 [Nostoc sp. CENA543]
MSTINFSLTNSVQTASQPYLVDFNAENLTNFNGTLYFTKETNFFTQQLWRIDQSSGGSEFVLESRDINLSYYINPLVNVNGVLYFRAYTSTYGSELYRIDNATDQPVRINEINPGEKYSYPDYLVNINGILYFIATDHTYYSRQLYRIDNITGEAVRLTDINPGSVSPDNLSTYSNYLVNIDEKLYFSAYTPAYGAELYQLDTTTGESVRVTDINPGRSDSSPSNLININSTLYFVAYEPTSGRELSGRELYRLDTTTGESVRVNDINPGADSSWFSSFTKFNDTLYFTENYSRKLYRIDNATGNAVIVPGINSGSEFNFTEFNGTLYFTAYISSSGYYLYRIDNATGNAVLVQGINSSVISNVFQLTKTDDKLYFRAYDPTYGSELYRIDDTTGNAVLVADINPGADSSNPQNLTNINGTLYFSAYDPTYGSELYRLDSATGQAVRLTDINPGAEDSSPSNLVYANGTLYFNASSPDYGSRLWGLAVSELPNRNPIVESDRFITTVNTPIVISLANLLANDQDVDGGKLLVTNLSQPSYGNLVNNNDGTYTYIPDSNYRGFDRFTYTVSDGQGGTSTATVDINIGKPYLIRDFNEDYYFEGLGLTVFKETLYLTVSNPRDTWVSKLNNNTGEISSIGGIENNHLRFIVLNDRLYAIIFYRFEGSGISKVDVSTGRLVIEQTIDNINTTQPTKINGTYYFISYNYSYGNDSLSLWKIDNNTGNFVELVVTDFPRYIDGYVEVNDTVYFTTGNTETLLQSLWKIDNSTGNEVLITDINTGSNDDYTVGTLFNLNGVLYFVASDSNYGTELWKLDSSSNPQRVTDINPGSGSASPKNFVNVNNTLYFIANDGTTGEELWKIDNTTGKAVQVEDINPGASSVSPKNFVNVNNTLYFIANDGTTGEEWWKIDNTTGKAVQVEDINPGAGSIAIYQQFTLNDTFYFSADDGITGIELWKIDPITGDVVRLTDINPGFGSANPNNLTNVNGTLYFFAYAKSQFIDNQVWKIDNTGKAVRFVDTLPESGLSNVSIPTLINGKLYFSADNAIYGRELWEFDESSNQLRILTDAISPGTESSNIYELAYLNGKLYFNNDGELWALDLNSDAITGTSASETLNGTDSNDVVYGLDGNDKLLGKAGNDILSGGAGNDTLDGGFGADTLVGGTENDIYYVDNLGDVIVEEAKAGKDLVQAAISWQLADNLENLVLTGSASINGTGNSRNNVLTGNSAANVLSGGDGDDWLFGLAGNDTLNGNNGNDIINGGKGNDLLIGGRGNDSLTGDAGRDSFQLSLPVVDDFDTITDFSIADDKILISKAEFGLNQSLGVLNTSAFRLGTSATTASDRFIYDQATGNLFFDTDGLSGNTQIQIAQLTTKPLLSNTHITIIA